MIRCTPRSRGEVERQLEIGGVLVGRMTLDDRAARARTVDRGRIGGIEVTDDVVDVQPEQLGLMQTRVGGNDDCIVGQKCS